jgi:hypothetical protein
MEAKSMLPGTSKVRSVIKKDIRFYKSETYASY